MADPFLGGRHNKRRVQAKQKNPPLTSKCNQKHDRANGRNGPFSRAASESYLPVPAPFSLFIRCPPIFAGRGAAPPVSRRRGSSGAAGRRRHEGETDDRDDGDSDAPPKRYLNGRITKLHNVRAEPIRDAKVVGYLVATKQASEPVKRARTCS